MTQIYDVVIEKDADGYFVASIPAIPGCHTQAKTLDALMMRIKEAAQLCLEVMQTDRPAPEFVGVQRIAIPV